MTDTPALRRFLSLPPIRLLTRTAYGPYLIGNGISLTGTWMQRLACMYLVWQMTGSAFWLGVVSMVDMLPVFVIGLFAGAAADRWNLMRLMRLCQSALALIALIFGLCSLSGILSLPLLIALALVQGCTVALGQPARMSLVQSLVAREDVGAAVALSSVNVNTARLTGPAIAGLMLVAAPIYWIFFLNSALTVIFVCILLALKLRHPPKRNTKGSFLSLISGGIAYTLRDRGIRTYLLCLFVGGACVRAMMELFPAIAARNFDHSAAGLATLTSCMAAGAVLSGVTLGIEGRTAGLGRRIALSWTGAGLAVALLAFSPMAATDIVIAAFMGFCTTRVIISTQTYVQLAAPEALRGRVLSVHGLVSRGSPALGALGIGWAIDLFGLTGPLLAASALCLTTTLGLFLWNRDLASGDLVPGTN